MLYYNKADTNALSDLPILRPNLNWCSVNRTEHGTITNGMAKLAYAAAYIRANMPFTINYKEPVLSVQQAWDVAAYMISKPRPPAPVESEAEAKLPE